MKRLATTSLTLLAFALLLTIPASAGPGDRWVDPDSRATIEGTVVELQAVRGEGRPTLILDTPDAGRMAIRLGPYWMIDDANFTATAGDAVRLVTFLCSRCDADAVAGQVENLTTGEALELRDDQGVPLWMGKGCRGRRGDGPGLRHGKRGRGPGSGMGPGMGPGRGPGDGSGPRCPR